MKIPFVDLKAQYLSIKKDIDHAIQRVVDESAFIGGKYVNQFREQFAQHYGIKHVIPCANGTDSLYIIMKMLGIGPGDEVITPANSWISSAETISQTGATPVFVDIHPEYYSLDEAKLELNLNKKTKALIAVHLQGQMCDMPGLASFCKNHQIALIEDCAQSHFSEYEGIRAGLWGLAGSFSFFPGKNLGAYGDAGCIISNDDQLAEKCRMYANHGALVKHQHKIEGINSRMDGLQASILLAKLPHILEWNECRIRIARMYEDQLGGIPEITLPKVRPNTKHTFHLFVVRVQRRSELMEFLKQAGVETLIHYPSPLPLMEAYQRLGYQAKDIPVAAGIKNEILSLPIYPEMTEAMVRYVVQQIQTFYHR